MAFGLGQGPPQAWGITNRASEAPAAAAGPRTLRFDLGALRASHTTARVKNDRPSHVGGVDLEAPSDWDRSKIDRFQVDWNVKDLEDAAAGSVMRPVVLGLCGQRERPCHPSNMPRPRRSCGRSKAERASGANTGGPFFCSHTYAGLGLGAFLHWVVCYYL